MSGVIVIGEIQVKWEGKSQFKSYIHITQKLKHMNKQMGKLLLQILVIKIVLILIVVGGIIIYTYNSI
jgi:hypothetical protein